MTKILSLLLFIGLVEGRTESYLEPIVKFYKNGNKKLKGFTKNGKREGKWYYYWDDGLMYKEMHTYKDGILDGEYREWAVNGGITFKGFVKDNTKISTEQKKLIYTNKRRYSKSTKANPWKNDVNLVRDGDIKKPIFIIFAVLVGINTINQITH